MTFGSVIRFRERFRHSTVQGYVLREYLFSVLVAFLFFIAIFFVNQILVIARDRLAEQVSILDTLMLIFYAMPAIVALSILYSSFIGIILSVGKLSEGREILAARAGGMSLQMLIMPVFAGALFLTCLAFVTNDYFLPLGTMNYSRLYQELLYSNTRLIIEPYSIRRYENSTLITGAVIDNKIQGLIILDTTEDGTERSISAGQAELVRNDRTGGIITLKLDRIEMISMKDNLIHESTADTMDYNIVFENIVFSMTNPSVREMSARDVLQLIRQRREENRVRLENESLAFHIRRMRFLAAYAALVNNYSERRVQELRDLSGLLHSMENKSTVDQTLRLYTIEFWQKLSLPLGSLSFILLGFSIGLSALKYGRTLGIITGLIVASVYWGMLVAINQIGLNLTYIPAVLVCFTPNILLTVVGGFLFRNYLRR